MTIRELFNEKYEELTELSIKVIENTEHHLVTELGGKRSDWTPEEFNQFVEENYGGDE